MKDYYFKWLLFQFTADDNFDFHICNGDIQNDGVHVLGYEIPW